MSSIVTPPIAPSTSAVPVPSPVAPVAAGTPAAQPAVGVPQEGADDITITSTSDTPEQVTAALLHKVPDPPAPTAEETAAAAAAAAIAAETAESGPDAAAASAAASTLAKRKKSGLEEMRDRVDQVTYEREENRRRAETEAANAAGHAAEVARLKAENEALRTGKPVPGVTPPVVETPKKPELKDFEAQPDPYAAYTEAVAEWTADRAVEKVRAELKGDLSTRDQADLDRQARAAAELDVQRTFDVHKARVDTFRAATPDYDTTVANAMTAIKDSPEGVFFIPQALAEHVQLTETGPALFYHLVQDVPEFRRIAGMKQVGPMLVALGKYEAKLEGQGKLAPKAPPPPPDAATRARDALTSSSTPAATVTKAPPPPSLVGGGSTASTVPLEELDFREYAKQRNAAERTRRR